VQPDQERPHVGATSNLIALRRTGVFESPTMDRFLSEAGVLDGESRTIPTAIAQAISGGRRAAEKTLALCVEA
jgi:hypothetical protein